MFIPFHSSHFLKILFIFSFFHHTFFSLLTATFHLLLCRHVTSYLLFLSHCCTSHIFSYIIFHWTIYFSSLPFSSPIPPIIWTLLTCHSLLSVAFIYYTQFFFFSSASLFSTSIFKSVYIVLQISIHTISLGRCEKSASQEYGRIERLWEEIENGKRWKGEGVWWSAGRIYSKL